MRTRREDGVYVSTARLLEMLEFRFGAFEAIASAALELARKDPEDKLPMDVGRPMRFSSSATICGRPRVLLANGRGSPLKLFQDSFLRRRSSSNNAE
jgi:hypothetical protein